MAHEVEEEDYSEDVKKNLKSLVDHFSEEDRSVRERQIRLWRKLKFYWTGFTRIWYSETAHDWRVWDNTANNEDTNDMQYYDKPMNVFKAYLESIIAALSITIPGVRCAPDDADNPLDLSTAKAGNKIAKLIGKHNDVSYLWLHALYIYCTEGLVFCYSYPKDDKAYGTYEKHEYQDDTIEGYACPYCGTHLTDELFTELEQDEFMPDEDDVELHDIVVNEQQIICPECAKQLDPELQKTNLTVQKLIGITNAPKTRQCMEVYGGLYVKVPNYVKKQEDMPYLIFSYECHFSSAIEMYPNLKDKLNVTGQGYTGGTTDQYERWGRLNTQYYGEYPVNNVTVRNCWFRPSAYNIFCNDEKSLEELKKEFPDGVKVVFVDDCFADACNESLDDCWTLTKNPMADYLHHDPLGLMLISVQDLTNDLVSLVVQTIEQGIVQTWVDPALVNVDEYGQVEATPGGITPTKAVPATKNISEGFFSLKPATLSEEVLPFADRVQQLGQLIVGAQPSIFGGELGGSKTASEYSMSRAQALQRLQTPWKMMSNWWKAIFGKVIPSYIKDMAGDERLVERDKQGNYINVFIRKAEVQGKIGDIELETSENLPVSWAQVKDVLMRIMELNNPVLLEALFSPENLPYVTEVLGLTDFKLPGEEDRQKQLEEIQELLQSQPIITEEGEFPSVEIDEELDRHDLEAEMCRNFLISEQGRLAKVENPEGYYNVLLHFKMHNMVVQMMAMQQQQAELAAQGVESGGEDNSQEGEGIKAPKAEGATDERLVGA